jgi:hypothetical protein
MKKDLIYFLHLTYAFIIAFCPLDASAQDTTEMKIISAFDSLIISDVKAIGNIETNSMEISMVVHNDYYKMIDAHWSLGGFEDLGITDDKGKKYKVLTSTKLIGTANINNGFKSISGVQFGSKKMDWLTYVKDTLSAGDSKKLVIRVPKVDKTVKSIKELHIRCILSKGYMWAGDKSYQINNIKVEWIKPSVQSKPNSIKAS